MVWYACVCVCDSAVHMCVLVRNRGAPQRTKKQQSSNQKCVCVCVYNYHQSYFICYTTKRARSAPHKPSAHNQITSRGVRRTPNWSSPQPLEYTQIVRRLRLTRTHTHLQKPTTKGTRPACISRPTEVRVCACWLLRVCVCMNVYLVCLHVECVCVRVSSPSGATPKVPPRTPSP